MMNPTTPKNIRKVLILNSVALQNHLHDMFENLEHTALSMIEDEDYLEAAHVLMDLAAQRNCFNSLSVQGVQIWKKNRYMADCIFSEDKNLDEIVFEDTDCIQHLLAKRKDFDK